MRHCLVTLLALMAPWTLRAQDFADCTGCYIGIYDDQDLSVNFGFWDQSSSPIKTIWVGILYESSVPSEMQQVTGIELSVDGFPPSPFGPPAFVGVPDPALQIGDNIKTPDDEISGEGGINLAWRMGLPGNRALIRIDMLSLDPVGNDIVITVRRSFPASSPNVLAPLFTQADSPLFTKTRVNGGCYVLNPSVDPGGTVDGCKLTQTIAVETSTWSTIKSLYRD